MSHNGSKNY